MTGALMEWQRAGAMVAGMQKASAHRGYWPSDKRYEPN